MKKEKRFIFSLAFLLFSSGSIIFSEEKAPQSLALVAAQEDGKLFLVLNGQKGKPYDEIQGLRFSPDNRQIAYYAFSGNQIWWVVEEVK